MSVATTHKVSTLEVYDWGGEYAMVRRNGGKWRLWKWLHTREPRRSKFRRRRHGRAS